MNVTSSFDMDCNKIHDVTCVASQLPCFHLRLFVEFCCLVRKSRSQMTSNFKKEKGVECYVTHHKKIILTENFVTELGYKND